MIRAGHPHDPEYAEKLTEQRMQRQQILDRNDEPLELVAIVDEAALRQLVGSRKLMRQQWNHLVDKSEHPLVTLQVLPSTVGAHTGQHGSFQLFDFPNPDDPGVVYLEVLRGGIYLWRKSSHSGPNGGDCVEIATCACQAAIRDSKVPNGPHLTISPADFAAFLNSVRR